MRAATSIAAVLLLCDCGGGNDTAAPPPAPLPQLQFTAAASTAIQGDSVLLLWTSANATACVAFGDWSGPLPTAGQLKVRLARYGQIGFGLRCSGVAGTSETVVTVVSRVAVGQTSYANFKEVGLLPTDAHFAWARAYGDFFENGSLSQVSARNTYDVTKPLSEATVGVIEFWTSNANGTWTLRPNAIAVTEAAPCIHARKAIVADFNEDRKPDLLLLCTGYDGAPFPGEHMLVLLSQPGAGYLQRYASPDVAFFHGGAACDLNLDGHMDLVAATGAGLRVYTGDGRGGFARALNHPLSTATSSLFGVECLDVDEDGVTDVIAGGQEWVSPSGATSIFFGRGGGTFARQLIPAIANDAAVLDFTVTGTGAARTLWVDRTSGGDGTSYASRVVQRVNVRTLESVVVVNQRPAVVITWLIPYSRGGLDFIGSDRRQDNFEIVR